MSDKRKLERIIEIYPAWDKRDPDPHKDYGINSVEMRFVLKGPEGVVQFLLNTGWHLPHITEELEKGIIAEVAAGRDISVSLRCNRPLPMFRGYHSPTPRYKGQEAHNGCCYLDGKPCYSESSYTNAQVIFDTLLREGGDGVWRELEYYYTQALLTPILERTVEGAELGVLMKTIFEGGVDEP